MSEQQHVPTLPPEVLPRLAHAVTRLCRRLFNASRGPIFKDLPWGLAEGDCRYSHSEITATGGWKHIYVVPAPVMNGFFRKQLGATRAELFSRVDGDLEVAGPRYLRNLSSRNAARVPDGCDAFAKGELSDDRHSPFTYSSHEDYLGMQHVFDLTERCDFDLLGYKESRFQSRFDAVHKYEVVEHGVHGRRTGEFGLIFVLPRPEAFNPHEVQSRAAESVGTGEQVATPAAGLTARGPPAALARLLN